MNVMLVHVSLRFVPLVRSYECRAGPRFFALRVINPKFINVVQVHVSLRFVSLVRNYERRARPCFFALRVISSQL